MTEEKLKRAYELSDNIKSKKARLNAYLSCAKKPKGAKVDIEARGGIWNTCTLDIPAKVVKEEALRQAKILSDEIKKLEREFELL